MISKYNYIYDYGFEEPEMPKEDVDIVMNSARETFKGFEGTLSKDLLESVFQDVEEWMSERYTWVLDQYFSNIIDVLFQAKEYPKQREKIQELLTDVGYTSQTFRKALYLENKESIDVAIAWDRIYEQLKDKFSTSNYFKSWNFSDMKTRYPQTEIVDGFLNYLINKEGFNETMIKKLDCEIQRKMEEYEELKRKIRYLSDTAEELIEAR